MINYQQINSALVAGTYPIPYQDGHEVFARLYQDYHYKFLLESKDISAIYGRLSLIGLEPVLKISGKGENFAIEVLHERGADYFQKFSEKDFSMCDCVNFEPGKISGVIRNNFDLVEETERSKRNNIAQIIRVILEKFSLNEAAQLGLYGGFSYDFIRLFEKLPELTPENDTNDFTLFLYDTFIFFDHLKQKSEITVYRDTPQAAADAVADVLAQLNGTEAGEFRGNASARECLAAAEISYEITDPQFSLSESEYQDLVEVAKEYARDGELFEVVFSNILRARFQGDPFGLYLKYRECNPSPYLFYFDFGDEQLVGASPEMMVRCEQSVVHLRPISGTARRGQDPIEDHENMLALLSDPKERAELDMLIDLGRNDLSRVCEPGIEISDYRFVEKYSQVMHTVAHLSGKLRQGYTALDALIACLNAGTLTGAPKVAAMETIERHEKERRGYYGGTIGYLTFSGNMDTGIIIRTAHIRGDELRFQVGATLLYDSVPEKEYQETLAKASAFLHTFTNLTHV